MSQSCIDNLVEGDRVVFKPTPNYHFPYAATVIGRWLVHGMTKCVPVVRSGVGCPIDYYYMDAVITAEIDRPYTNIYCIPIDFFDPYKSKYHCGILKIVKKRHTNV